MGKEPTYEVLTCYDNKVRILFYPKNHLYFLERRDWSNWIPSVTGITGVVGAEALIWWSARCAAEYWQGIIKPGEEIYFDEADIDKHVSASIRAHKDEKDRAATIGSTVHEWIKNYTHDKIAGKYVDLKYPANIEAKRAVISFLEWVEENTVEFHESEQIAYSRANNYIGRFDVTATINGDLGIVDYKTSGGMYFNYYWQVAGYRHAKTEETGQDYPGSCILHIPKDGGIVKQYSMTPEIYEESFEAFRACQVVHRIKRVHEKHLKDIMAP